MFAGAAREVVFSNPEVVRRVNEEFIPVALKAAFINNPPRGIEGELYAEISRSKPAPQGICTTNSAGKVLAWALSFDDDASILEFLDHVQDRYRESPDASKPVTAEQFMNFPSRKLKDVADTGKLIDIPEHHAGNDRCPGTPAIEAGTLVGRIIGRALDEDGNPVADTIRQEHYMEARFEVPVVLQQQLAAAVEEAAEKQFQIPSDFARGLISHAFLGQLDVNPLGNVPGSRNENARWEFFGQTIPSPETDVVRVRIEGESHVEGGQDGDRSPRTDGRLWEHRVTLNWQGYVDIKEKRVVQLVMLANGDERLRWGNPRFNLSQESDAQHLMAGHPIDLTCGVRYGLVAEPGSPDEVVEGAGAPVTPAGRGALPAKIQRLQAGLQRLQQSGGDTSEIFKLMKDIGPLMKKQQIAEAEALVDQALKLLEESGNAKRDR